MVIQMANDEWFDDPEEESQQAEQEIDINGEQKSVEPEAPTEEKSEAADDVPANDTIAITTLHNFRQLLLNKRFMLDNDLQPKTCKKLHQIIGEMMGHGGKPLEGIRTIDGLTMYPCPKHEYAPICKCLKECEYFDGVDNAGVCIAQESRIPGFPRYTHFEALQMEREARREGYQFALHESRDTIKKTQKNLKAFELEAEDGQAEEGQSEEEDF